jgi:DNA-directed RNA polymerase specialized sigma24 family protein
MAELEEVYRQRFEGFVGGVLALSVSVEAARDAVQEGFAKAVASRHRFRVPGRSRGGFGESS